MGWDWTVGGLELHSTLKTEARRKRVVAPTFSKIGIVVPFDKETEVRHRFDAH